MASKEDAKCFALIQQYKITILRNNGNLEIQALALMSTTLMYSMQESPSDGFSRDKPLNVAVEEILMDRRAAIMSGKLRGRRLFRAAEKESDGGGEVYNRIQEREVMMNSEYKFPFGKVVVVEVAEKGGGRGGDRRLSVVLLAVVLLVFSVGLIFMSCNCNAKFLHKNAGFINLVPT